MPADEDGEASEAAATVAGSVPTADPAPEVVLPLLRFQGWLAWALAQEGPPSRAAAASSPTRWRWGRQSKPSRSSSPRPGSAPQVNGNPRGFYRCGCLLLEPTPEVMTASERPLLQPLRLSETNSLV
ncbi:uncharacterized protein LOC133909966 isoform X2 [Phragmites australis]|uniref:uncharacterized protein LOC133909966 isoform X2 n=1 Tax=Phragmites australis TaxID=29695 RepID=UPI002D78D0A4|nr:uncharacterized protein LOC133909966 isoform X2 [Phragmites australis]